jgi:hypothetical protein
MTQSAAVSAATALGKQKDGADLDSHRADETNGLEDKKGIARIIKVSPRTPKRIGLKSHRRLSGVLVQS